MRNRYLDLLRALAIVRVVVYHVTGAAVLTIVFPAMSVMFALAGSLMAASVDHCGIRAIGRRLRRLLPSLWVICGLCVPAMLLTGLAWDWRILFWIAPLLDPPANSWGAAALSANWYLRDFLWFVLLSPVVLPLFRRFPLPVLLTPYVFLTLTEFKVITITNVVLRDITLYFGAWILGFAHHDGMLRRLTWRRLVPVATLLALAGAAWFLTHPGPRGFDLNDIRLGNALWSAAFVLLALGLAPDDLGWLDRRPALRRVVTVLNCRALTIYLWHVPVVVAVGAVATAAGWAMIGGYAVTVRFIVVVLLVAIAVALFGWVEDLAAGRPLRLLPGGPRRVDGRPARPVTAAPSGNVPRPRPEPDRQPATLVTAARPAAALPAAALPANPLLPDPPRLALPALVALTAAANAPLANGSLASGPDREIASARLAPIAVP